MFASLLEAIVRLAPIALEPVLSGMSTGHWLAYGGFAAFNAYAEGYRGFQCAFAPRVAARAVLLKREPTRKRVLLAPLFLMALVDASKRRLIANWCLVLGITFVVLLVRRTPQPWRGIIDGGVVVGLTWGTLASLWFLAAAALGRAPDVDPELPEPQS